MYIINIYDIELANSKNKKRRRDQKKSRKDKNERQEEIPEQKVDLDAKISQLKQELK